MLRLQSQLIEPHPRPRVRLGAGQTCIVNFLRSRSGSWWRGVCYLFAGSILTTTRRNQRHAELGILRRGLRFLDDESSAAVGAEINRSRLPFHFLYGVLSLTRWATWRGTVRGLGHCWRERRFADYPLQSGEARYGLRVRPYICMNAEARKARPVRFIGRPSCRRRPDYVPFVDGKGGEGRGGFSTANVW